MSFVRISEQARRPRLGRFGALVGGLEIYRDAGLVVTGIDEPAAAAHEHAVGIAHHRLVVKQFHSHERGEPMNGMSCRIVIPRSEATRNLLTWIGTADSSLRSE